MYPHICLRNKSFAAERTTAHHFSLMLSDVISVSRSESKFFAAKITFERFLSGMHPHVRLKLTFGHELLRAGSASDRFLASMGSHVLW